MRVYNGRRVSVEFGFQFLEAALKQQTASLRLRASRGAARRRVAASPPWKVGAILADLERGRLVTGELVHRRPSLLPPPEKLEHANDGRDQGESNAGYPQEG
jgi:hypothetical protein